MVEVANEPAVVLICVVLASALLVAEFALPTLGLAGALGFGLLFFAIVGINDADLDWWPLSLVAVAVVFWCVMVARRLAPPVQQGVTIALFTAGSVGFGVLAGDVTTVVVALLGSAGLAAGFPRPLRAVGPAARRALLHRHGVLRGPERARHRLGGHGRNRGPRGLVLECRWAPGADRW